MKKGQVTVFIIIGIILLLSLGVILYLQQVRVEEFEAAIPVVEDVPAEMQPVRSYIASCVEEVGKDAIKKIGDFGGYINKEKLSFNPVEPTEDEAVQFAPQSDLVIPYWYHLAAENDCRGTCPFSDARPALYRTPGEISVQQQIEDYVVENLDACINDFLPFQQHMSFEELEPLSVEATIAREDVVFIIDWPLQVEREGQTFRIDKHLATVDVGLQYMYNLGTQIANAQAEYRFLEKHARQLIDIFSKIDSSALPPTGELNIEFGMGEFWIKQNVQEQLQRILQSYVPLLQVGSTRNYRFIEGPENVRDPALYEAIYNRNMLVPGVNNTRPEMGASFTYLDWWTPYFDLNCKGQLCKAQTVGNTYGFIFGIQRYEFDYDLSYPVLVELTDPTALGGDGYSFKFFIEANMRNNGPMPAQFNLLEAVPAVQESLLCLPQHRESGNISISVIDGKTADPVDEAAVVYSCGDESCNLGITVNGTLETTLPRCIGGIVSASKVNYANSYEPLDIRNNDNHDIDMILQPYRTINISVEKYKLRKTVRVRSGDPVTATYSAQDWYVPATHGADVGPGEDVVIGNWRLDTGTTHRQEFDEDTLVLLSRVADDFEEPHTVVGQVCGTQRVKSKHACGEPPLEQRQIRLVPGTYKINIYSFKYAEPDIIFPPQKKKISQGPFKKKKTVWIPPEPIIFNATNPWPGGMAEVEWTVTASQLDRAQEIVFKHIYVAIEDVPEQNRYLDDMEQIGNTLDFARQAQRALQPEIKRKR